MWSIKIQLALLDATVFVVIFVDFVVVDDIVTVIVVVVNVVDVALPVVTD